MKKTTAKDIITLPDPRLRQKSEPVIRIDNEARKCIAAMKQAALDWEENRPNENSAALAAVQIGVMKRIIIIREDFDNKSSKNFIALINPEITQAAGRKSSDFEGCLSVPDFYGKVPRFNKIKIKAKNEEGKTIFLKAEGFLARILQHEIDHTNGITFVDRIKNNKEAFYKLTKDGELRKVDYEAVIAAGIFGD